MITTPEQKEFALKHGITTMLENVAGAEKAYWTFEMAIRLHRKRQELNKLIAAMQHKQQFLALFPYAEKLIEAEKVKKICLQLATLISPENLSELSGLINGILNVFKIED